MRSRFASILMLLAFHACGERATNPSPTLSLAVTPNPATFYLMPPRGQPNAPPPPCCSTLVSRWTLDVASNVPGTIQSASVIVKSTSTGVALLNRSFAGDELASQGLTTIGAAGAHAILQQALLDEVPVEFARSGPHTLRIEIAFRSSGGLATVGATELPLQELR